jgi:hypothetical protein
MRRFKIVAIVAMLATVVAACSSSSESSGSGTGGSASVSATGRSRSTASTPTGLVTRRWGDERADIVLASIARANKTSTRPDGQAVGATTPRSATPGTGGDVVMGYADGGGDNVWRHGTRMEAILQALTYPQIGKMLFRDAHWDTDPSVAANDIEFLIQAGATFIIGYPDQGTNLDQAILDAKAAGIPYSTYSAGWVGLPGQQDALVPGKDYLTVVARTSARWAELRPGHRRWGRQWLGRSDGRHPGNALSAGWQSAMRGAQPSIRRSARPTPTG